MQLLTDIILRLTAAFMQVCETCEELLSRLIQQAREMARHLADHQTVLDQLIGMFDPAPVAFEDRQSPLIEDWVNARHLPHRAQTGGELDAIFPTSGIRGEGPVIGANENETETQLTLFSSLVPQPGPAHPTDIAMSLASRPVLTPFPTPPQPVLQYHTGPYFGDQQTVPLLAVGVATQEEIYARPTRVVPPSALVAAAVESMVDRPAVAEPEAAKAPSVEEEAPEPQVDRNAHSAEEAKARRQASARPHQPPSEKPKALSGDQLWLHMQNKQINTLINSLTEGYFVGHNRR